MMESLWIPSCDSSLNNPLSLGIKCSMSSGHERCEVPDGLVRNFAKSLLFTPVLVAL